VGAAIGQVLGLAVGIAISPVPIIAVILMLFSRQAARNSVSFLIGWLFGLVAVVTIVLAVGVGGSDGSSDGSGWTKVVIGALFLVLGVRQWRNRPADGTEPEMPGWMAGIDDLAAGKAFALGALLSGVNPKNLGLALAAGATIDSAGLDTGEEVVTAGVFVLIASITIIAPVVGYLIAGERARPMLTQMKDWLTHNNATVMTVLFVVLGAKVLGDGLAIVA
jgi:threonine/homoserine/homoserine lactone efflux protein